MEVVRKMGFTRGVLEIRPISSGGSRHPQENNFSGRPPCYIGSRLSQRNQFELARGEGRSPVKTGAVPLRTIARMVGNRNGSLDDYTYVESLVGLLRGRVGTPPKYLEECLGETERVFRVSFWTGTKVGS
jgi:hypothetical protein